MSSPDAPPKLRVVSGGQTGVDRAALDAASAVGVPCGGWCPRGRKAEDGVIPARYPLRETESDDYAVRTERNVLDSDGTLIVTRGALSGGTALTARLAQRHGKPLFVVDLAEAPEVEACRGWLAAEAIAVLNVAGPRESGRPGIGAAAQAWLEALLVLEERE